MSSLLASQVGNWSPEIYRAVVRLYIDAGYFGVDDLWVPPSHGSISSALAGASSVRILEKAISDRNLALACALIEAGAATNLVPAHTCSLTVPNPNGATGFRHEVVQAGDFLQWVDVSLGANSPMTLEIRHSMMKGVIGRGQASMQTSNTEAITPSQVTGHRVRRSHI